MSLEIDPRIEVPFVLQQQGERYEYSNHVE